MVRSGATLARETPPGHVDSRWSLPRLGGVRRFAEKQRPALVKRRCKRPPPRVALSNTRQVSRCLIPEPEMTEKNLAAHPLNGRKSQGPATPEGKARSALMAPKDENALLMQRMEDSTLRQSWWLTNVLIRVRNGALTQKDVKNEGRSGYVPENKG